MDTRDSEFDHRYGNLSYTAGDVYDNDNIVNDSLPEWKRNKS